MGKKKKEGKRETKSALESLGRRIVELLSAKTAGPDERLAAELGLPAAELEKQLERGRQLRRSLDPRAVVELAPALQMAFLLLAEEDGDEDVLGDLLSLLRDDEVKKEAKRVLHRLRSRGMRIEVPTEPRASVLERRPQEDAPSLACYLSPPDGEGLRHIWMARYAPGGVEVFQFSASDSEGLVEFNGGVLGRNRYRQLLAELLEGRQQFFLEISYPEARKRLAAAVELSRSTGRVLPEEYLSHSAALPEVEDFPLAPAQQAFPRERLEAGLAEKAAQLFDDELFSEWLPDQAVMRQLDQSLAEVENMQVVIDDAQRLSQINRAIDKAQEAMLEGEKRSRWKERLFEMADFLRRKGKEEAAWLAAATAWQLEEPDFQPGRSAFFSRLLRRVLKSPEEIMQSMRPPSPPPSPSSPAANP